MWSSGRWDQSVWFHMDFFVPWTSSWFFKKHHPNSKPFFRMFLSQLSPKKKWNTSPQSQLNFSIFATWQRQNQQVVSSQKVGWHQSTLPCFWGISQFWEHEFLPMSPPNHFSSPASQPPTSVPATWQRQPMALRYEAILSSWNLLH